MAESTEGQARSRGARALAVLSHLASRTQFMQKLGIQYGGKRDVYTVAGYPKDLQFADFWGLYRRGDIAGRIVDMAPQTTWRTPPEIVEPGMDMEEKTEFVKAFEALAKRLRLWSVFERADRLAGVGRYSVILIGVPGEDRELKQPLPKLEGPQDVLYLAAYHEGVAAINTWVKDSGDPRFGLPETYQIDFASGVKEFTVAKAEVHASRVIHVAEDKLADGVYGRPRLERVYNRLMDLEKIAAATGEAYWQLAVRILTGSIDPATDLPNGVGDKMVEQLEEIVHDLRRTFVGQGVSLEWLQSTPPDPESAADLMLSLIAGATGYPKRILFGSETGERASEQDQRHYLGLINERQERFAEPEIVRAFIDRLIEVNGLPTPSTGEYEVVWPELYEMTEDERAEASRKRAETAKALTPMGGDPLRLVNIDDAGNVWLKSTAVIEQEQAPELEDADPPEPEGADDDGEEEDGDD